MKYKQDSAKELSKFHLPMDMMEVAHAKKAQSLVSDQDYRLTLHQYTTLPDDMKVQAAKRAYALQSEVRPSATTGKISAICDFTKHVFQQLLLLQRFSSRF